MVLDYRALLNDAALNIVKEALIGVQRKGLPPDRSLYISFLTGFKDVVLSKSIREKYPKEITIVLQHQFRNLRVLDSKFMVNLSFNGIGENIEVPFRAITNFADPVANFVFQFVSTEQQAFERKKFLMKGQEKVLRAKTKDSNLSLAGKKNNVVAIDKFRKNREIEKNPS